jgi:glucan 1,3-beta-glucosidase
MSAKLKTVLLSFLLISISIFLFSQTPTIKFFGIYSDEHPSILKFDKEAALFVWENTGILKESNYNSPGSKLKYMSFDYDNSKGWFGFGFAVIPNGVYFDLSEYKNGYLNVNLKSKDSPSVLKIGMKSGTNDESWITNLSKYGFINNDKWHPLKIPIVDFAIKDISKISQFFMLAGEGRTPGKIEFDEIFFQNADIASSSSDKVLFGLNFSPYLKTQSPGIRSKISEEQIYCRLQLVEPFTRWIRTFSCSDGLENTGRIAHRMGLNTIIGACIGKDANENAKQIEAIIKIARAGDADIVAIGNEVLLRGDLKEAQLISYIKQAKNAIQKMNPGVKVSTVDGYYFFLTHPKLMDICDVILINCYPFWDKIKIDDSITALNRMYERMKKAAKGKEVIITETGWPSDGNQIGAAVPSKENGYGYFKRFLNWASKNDVNYFYFSSFDESWKSKEEGALGEHWGIFDSNGNLKYEVDDFKTFCLNTMKDGTILPIEGIYIPSGYMGDINDIKRTKSANTGIYRNISKIDLSAPSSPYWAGIYWQYPANNWGSEPGLKLYEPKRLTFYARGENGGEKVEFKIGGISDNFTDSIYPALSLDGNGSATRLTREWTQYLIDLEGQDSSSVIGGFCCVANRDNNPNGCVFYVSNIQFEW